MRKSMDVIEALEYIIKTRQGTVLLKDGGKRSSPKLMKGQEAFDSPLSTREYSIDLGKGERAFIKFIYDFRGRDTFAYFDIDLNDIFLIRQKAKELEKELSKAIKGNGHQEFPVISVDSNGAEVKLTKEADR